MKPKRSKIGDIEILDGGDRKDRLVEKGKREEWDNKAKMSYKQASHTTEEIMRTKYDKAFKNGEVKRGFCMGITFDREGKVKKEN